jgi:enoyl-CoA hydratase/carnithine racemase
MGRAKDLILTGEPISAERAEQIGLVSRVVPAIGFPAALDETVERFLAMPAASTRAAKQLTTAAYDLPFDTFREAMQADLQALCASDEHRAAVAAYHASRRAASR